MIHVDISVGDSKLYATQSATLLILELIVSCGEIQLGKRIVCLPSNFTCFLYLLKSLSLRKANFKQQQQQKHKLLLDVFVLYLLKHLPSPRQVLDIYIRYYVYKLV